MLAAGLLIASDLMTTFEFTPPGGEPQASQSAGDRHSYAQIVLGAFAIAALVVALANGSKPAAVAVAACGVLALLIFLLLDLPDANNVGALDDVRQSFVDAEAVPQAGFWLQLWERWAWRSPAPPWRPRPEQLRALGPRSAARETVRWGGLRTAPRAPIGRPSRRTVAKGSSSGEAGPETRRA